MAKKAATRKPTTGKGKSLVVQWVSPAYLGDAKLRALTASYRKATPYPHAALTGFLREEKAVRLARAVRSQQFFRKESDLFCFSQTKDLLGASDPTIQEFLTMIRSPEFREFMQAITGVPLPRGKVDAMGVIYADADYLLCHDDQLSGRKIAYILNLSKGFTAKSGGALALLESDRKKRPTKVVKRIVPTWNTLSFFTVSEVSHHMVEEVLEDKERLTIGGWLHG